MKTKSVNREAPFRVPEHLQSPGAVEHFYKYKSIDKDHPEYSSRIFTYNELYFSKVSAFNDPFDCRFKLTLGTSQKERIDYSKKMIKEYESGRNRKERNALAKQDLKTLTDPAFKARTEKGLREKIETWGVCCFSEVGDDILMWSHYANAHQGFCLKFSNELSVPDMKQTRRPIVPFKIKYSGDYPIADTVSDNRDNLVVPLITKAEQWKYEQEWRMINPGGPGPCVFPSHCLTGVIFGCQMSDEHKELIRTWCKDWQPAIKYYQARQSADSYRLHIDEIP